MLTHLSRWRERGEVYLFTILESVENFRVIQAIDDLHQVLRQFGIQIGYLPDCDLYSVGIQALQGNTKLNILSRKNTTLLPVEYSSATRKLIERMYNLYLFGIHPKQNGLMDSC
jgi:hypothetical protein